MKTSIFDMNFTLPPIVEMSEVEKDMMSITKWFPGCGLVSAVKTCIARRTHENIYL